MLPKKSSANKKTPKLVSKTPLRFSSLVMFVLIFAAVGGYILWHTFAAPAPPTVYLSPASQTLGPSTSFSVQVRENSGTTAVNAIQANLSYNPSLLTFVSISTTGTAFGVTAQTTGGSGVVNIGLGVSGGSPAVTGDQLVATITFTTTATGGTASVPFTTGTALVSSTTNTDILGSLAATAGGSFTTDTAPPTVSVTAPANGSTISAPGTVNVTASASDAASSVTKVELYVDGALKTTLTSSPYTYAWNTSGVALGSHTIQAKAYDTFNNVGTTALTSVTLADQTAPTTSITAPTAGTTLSGTVSVNANAADNTGGTGVSKVELYVDGTLNATDTATPYNFSWNTTTATNASHNLTVKAYDGAVPVNVATSAAVSVTVDNSPPTAPTGLHMSANTLTSISLAWTASTDNVAVTSYKLSRNGTLIATLPGSTLTYNDTGLSNTTSYNYSLVATDAANNTSAAAALTAATVTAKPGDLNGDNAVNVTDLSILLSNWNTTNAAGDVNKDGIVNIFDLSILLSNYGT
jgi:chitinase